MKRGGLAGGGCGEQMRKALQEAPDETFAKIAQGPNNRARNFAKQILNKIPKGGRIGSYYRWSREPWALVRGP